MKHSLKITLILVLVFMLTQVVGLGTVIKYMEVTTDIEGNVVIVHPDTVMGPPPVVEEKSFSFAPIIIAILIGTALVLVLIKFGLGRIWRYWFLLAVWVTLSVSFGVYINKYIAVTLALLLGLIKVYRPNVIVHNLTEIFIYTGITIIVINFLNIISAIVLLVLISVYDMIAVWKSRHMIKLAEFQAKEKTFAGLSIPYRLSAARLPARGGEKGAIKEKGNVRNAILGGGDLAFPLLFSAAVMENLIQAYNLAKAAAFFQTLIITLCVSAALLLLLVKSDKEKFYPAMPFLSAGCFIGYAIIFFLNFF